MNSAKYAIIALIRSFKTSCQLPSDMHKSLAQALAVFDCKQTAVVTDIAIDSVTDKEIIFTYIPTAYQYLIEKAFFSHRPNDPIISLYVKASKDNGAFTLITNANYPINKNDVVTIRSDLTKKFIDIKRKSKAATS